MDEDKDGPRIARYVTGRCARHEANETRRWAAEDASRAELLNALAQLWELVRRVSVVWDVDAAWRALGVEPRDATEPALGQGHAVPLSIIEPAPRSRRWRVVAVALAACALVAGVLVHHWHRASVAPPREIATRRGQRATLHLPDGTLVELGVASTIRYAPTYGRGQRDVYIEGDAYFEVAPDPRQQPFIVHAGNAVTRDRGTKFAVRAYPEASQVEVVVIEGSVDLNSVVLDAADLGRLDRGGRLSVEHGVDMAGQLSWRRGRLVFRDTPLREAVPQLNRWYDADLALGDSALGDYPLTASLRGEPLDKVLELITAALHVRVARRGATILLYRRAAGRTP